MKPINKRNKRLLTLILIISMAVCPPPGVSIHSAAKPILNKTKCNLKVGKTDTVTLKNISKNAKVKWSLSKKNIVKITKRINKITNGKTNGKSKSGVTIKALKAGKVILKAVYKYKSKTKTYRCTVNVTKSNKDKSDSNIDSSALSNAQTLNVPSLTTSDISLQNQGSNPTLKPVLDVIPKHIPTKKPVSTPTKTPERIPTNTPNGATSVPANNPSAKPGSETSVSTDKPATTSIPGKLPQGAVAVEEGTFGNNNALTWLVYQKDDSYSLLIEGNDYVNEYNNQVPWGSSPPLLRE